MAGLGPFEAHPVLAIGLSGGPDSTALLCLALDWVRPRGGAVTALCFDHRLRPGSERELDAAQALAEQLGAAVRRLAWDHAPILNSGSRESAGPSALMERARTARRAALQSACAAEGILHLLLGHHRDDQGETIVLRQERNSGPDGLAGMAALTYWRQCRILRPLLDQPKQRLLAYLRAREIPWQEDPSNRNPHFARARVRDDPDYAERIGAAVAVSREAAGRRYRAEQETDCGMAQAVRADAILGTARVDRICLGSLSHTLAARVLGRVLGWAGGHQAGISSDRASAVLALEPGGRVTLGGCQVIAAYDGKSLFVCRECRGLDHVRRALLVPLGTSELWDGRYHVSSAHPGWAVMALGARRAEVLVADPAFDWLKAIPAPARAALPMAYHDETGLRAAQAPHSKGILWPEQFAFPFWSQQVYSVRHAMWGPFPDGMSAQGEIGGLTPVIGAYPPKMMPMPRLKLVAAGLRRS